MRKIYPEFIENAHRDNFTNFANIGKDRWDTIVLNVLFKFSRKLKQENDFW